jgi:hypothetical protein
MPTLQRAPLREVVATRYVLPLREGGSLPGLMEADDLGTYVVKFHGAGQGRKALVAEVVVAELARAIGLNVPELVLVDVDPTLGKAEPDQEVQDLLRASPGHNLGVDYLPRALGYDPAADTMVPELAATIVWFDALVLNVDRSWRNPNLLRWHGETWLIDHGAALYFAHNWPTAATAAERPYAHVDEHVLLAAAGPIPPAASAGADALTDDVLEAAVAMAPDEWLAGEPGFDTPDDVRAAYVTVLRRRLELADAWVPQLEAARAAV